MRESELLGKLMPGHPNILPIIENIREKHQLPEVDPDGEPITEIYLGDDFIPSEDFRQKRRIDSRAQNPSSFVYGVGEN